MTNEKIEEILFREGLKIGALWRRMLAFIADDVLLSLLFIAFYVRDFQDLERVIIALSNAAIFLVFLRFFYHSIFTFLYGASLGKMIFGIKIVTISTLDRPNFLDSFVRSFFKELGTILFYATYFFAFFDPFFRTLHDRIVKTIVIQSRNF